MTEALESATDYLTRLILSLGNLEREILEKDGEEGQSLVEYAIAAALIAIVAMGAVQALGGGVAQVFQRILGRIQGMG